MSDSTRSGLSPARFSIAFALLAPLLVIGEIVLAVRAGLRFSDLTNADLVPTALYVVLGPGIAAPLFGVFVLLAERKRPRHSSGRGRLIFAASGALVHGLGNAAYGLARPSQALVSISSTASLIGAAMMIGAGFAAFALLSPQTRSRFFWAFDAVTLAAFGYVVSTLPSQPAEGAPDALTGPIIRHVVTTLMLMRLLVRALPYALSLIERTGLMQLVAARHLRSKKSGFLAAISMLSVLAVTVSCMALTTTLSVMGGFRNDLKRKILGNNAHIVVDRVHGSIEDWRPMLAATEAAPNVSGASPYVNGEVMLSSATNLATGVLRGIDPTMIGRVNDLPNNLQAGKLEYLSSPEKLLDLPPSMLQTSLLPVGSSIKLKRPDAGVADPDAGVAAGVERDAGTVTVANGTADAGAIREIAAETEKLQKKLDDIEAFLREPTRSRPDKARDVLPGIIVGKELARALRLYVGDEVNVVAPLGTLGPTGPMPKARPFRVAGIFYSGMPEYDMKFTYVALETAQKFLNLGDSISGIDVRVSDLDRAPEAASAIRGVIKRKDLRIRDWQELNSRLFSALALEKIAMFVTLGIAIVVASFCIAGTLTLMVQEKGREVAILKAMGTSDRAVVGVFIIEGGLIGLLGATLGLFLGFMLCFAAEHFGIRMNPDVYYMDRLPVHIDATEFALTGVAAVLLCLAITIYPALLASRLRPVDALRYE